VSDELLWLAALRQEMRDAVLTAIMAPDSTASISAWHEVDRAAIKLARQRRRYDKYIREVCRNAGHPLPAG
jgi:hypothetical protein